MKHFLLMVLFAGSAALVFGLLGRNDIKARVRYGFKVFMEFVGIGVALAWLLYIIS